jgi:aminopeptidase S
MADAHKVNRRGGTAVAAVLVAVSLSLSGCTVSRPDLVSGVDARAVLEAFKSRGMVDHLEALQRVADANGGNRASGTAGYEESVRYVEEQLRAAGSSPVRQTFADRRDGDSKDQQVKPSNILADTEGSPDRTVVVGGHLDSVLGGPGINDNASGVAAVLETASGWRRPGSSRPTGPVRVLGRRRGYPGRFTALHRRAERQRDPPDGAEPECGHDCFAERRGSVHDGEGSDFFGLIFVPARRIPALGFTIRTEQPRLMRKIMQFCRTGKKRCIGVGTGRIGRLGPAPCNSGATTTARLFWRDQS